MAINRQGARRRVRAITGWTAGAAAALTTAFAFGAARGQHAATASRTATPATPSTTPDQQTQTTPSQGDGFTPPSSSTQPPQAMSGGS